MLVNARAKFSAPMLWVLGCLSTGATLPQPKSLVQFNQGLQCCISNVRVDGSDMLHGIADVHQVCAGCQFVWVSLTNTGNGDGSKPLKSDIG